MTWKNPPIRLTVTDARCDEQALEVSYVVTNLGEREVFLLNRLFRVDRLGRQSVDPNLVWTRVVDDVLLLVKQLPEIPEWVSVESPQAPFLTRLAGGATFSESLRLSVPVEEYYPYMNPTRAEQPPHEVLCQHVVVVLGVFVPPSPDWVYEVTIESGVELAAACGHVVKAHEAVSSLPRPVRCPCLARSRPGEV